MCPSPPPPPPTHTLTVPTPAPAGWPFQDDPQLERHRRELIIKAATELDKARMIRYVESTGTLHSTDLGRTASHFYIKHVSIEVSARVLYMHTIGSVVQHVLRTSVTFDLVFPRRLLMN